MERLLVTNIGLLATPTGTAARGGAAQGEIRTLRDAWVLIEDGVIAALGTGTPAPAASVRVLDAGGRLATPGLVDAHTHLIFGGWRQDELALKLRGVSYLDILAQGGGILSTVRATRAASQEELENKARLALDEMRADGRYSKVCLCYVEGDEPARMLYEKLGFTHTGEADGDEIIMELAL